MILPDRQDLLQKIITGLRHRRLEVERVGDTLNLASGAGRMAHKANLDPEPFFAWLQAREVSEAEATRELSRQLGGYLRGVELVLSEPVNSPASRWSYEQSAGRMTNAIEVEGFIHGVEAATEGERPWHAPFAEGLIQVVTLSLDRGMRPLTERQVEAWGATDDRVFSAARSMLYHKTRDAELTPHPEEPGVFQVTQGDGFDAARCLVLPDVFFLELDEASFRFALPSPDLLLYTQAREDQPERLTALARAAKSAHDSEEYPLSAKTYKLAGGRPTTAAPCE